MFGKIAMLNSKTHGNKKIKPVNSFKFAANSYIASLMVNEFSRASGSYPIVFVKDGDMFRPFALLGLKRDENLFVDEDGKWTGGYIPAIIRRYPFVLGRSQSGDQFMVCIDEESEFLSEEEGNPLFDTEGKPTEIVENAKKYLADLQRVKEVTDRFSKELAERDLLKTANIQIKNRDGSVQGTIEGCYTVNEKALNELPDEDFLTMRKSGALPLIYAHLFSLAQMEKIIRKREEIAAR